VSDTAYMDAVRRGDLSTAQRLVDEAAKKSGFKVKRLYHGTPSKDPFYQFKKYTTYGYYFTPEKQVAQYYAGSGGRIIEVFLNLKRPANLLDVDSFLESAPDDFQVWIDEKFSGNRDSFKSWAESGELYSDNVGRTQDSLMRELQGLGYDGVIFEDSNWTGSPWNSYVVFNPSQIKSADPVTYDDAGNVIPLSQRFSDQSDDIRNPRTAPKQFPYEYAAYLKAHFPAIWAAGGNIRGNDTYRWWTAYRKGDRSPTVMRWWNVTRPAWIARHYRDYRLPGVIAQIKWGTVGTLGVAGMKRVVEDAIRKKL
jgi:hypothetical protein